MSDNPSVVPKPPEQPFATLGQMLNALLIQPPVVPLPEGEQWSDLIARINRFGVVNEVSEETYDYFLDVLPPKWMGREGFAFAEGAEPLRLFCCFAGGYRCRRLNEDETTMFCRLAGIQTPW